MTDCDNFRDFQVFYGSRRIVTNYCETRETQPRRGSCSDHQQQQQQPLPSMPPCSPGLGGQF